MGYLVIVLLLAAWAIVLLPSVVPKRFSSPVDGIRSFEQTMGILASARQAGQASGRWIMVPPDPESGPRRRRNRVIRKRRQNFQRLLLAAGVTLVLGLIPALRGFWIVHLVLDVALIGYTFQLRRWAMRESERARKVRHLPQEPQRYESDETAAFGSF